MRYPKFGDRIRGIFAGENNPHRDGTFVNVVRRRHGLTNPGTFYLLTDECGHFWEYEAKDTIRLGKREDAASEQDGGE